ncbi:hypothetical protein D3C81_1370340 [compost metagenome]
MGGVERLAGDIDESRRWRVGGLRQRINTQVLLDVLDARLRVAIDLKSPGEEHVTEGR